MPTASRNRGWTQLIGAIFGVAALLAGSGQAATLTIQEVEPVVYPELLVRPDLTTSRGYREVIQESGMVYVAVWAQVQVTWDGTAAKVHVPKEKMRLRAYDGAEYGPVGRMERYGLFSDDVQAFGRFRPSDWRKRPDEQMIFNTVFAVPKSRATFDLVLGGATTELKLSGKAHSLNPASYANFRLLNLARLEELPRVSRHRGRGFESLCERFLALTFTVEPLRSNGGPRRSFELETDWFALRDMQGGVYAPLGESLGGGWTTYREHNIPAVGPKRWDRKKVTLYFAIGTIDREYDLLFLGYPVLNTGYTASGDEQPGDPATIRPRPLRRP